MKRRSKEVESVKKTIVIRKIFNLKQERAFTMQITLHNVNTK